MIDETHDPARLSWVESANDHSEFPIQNLPFGVFSPSGGESRAGLAIGDSIFDLRRASEARMFRALGEATENALRAPDLSSFMALGSEARKAVRKLVSAALAIGGRDPDAERCLVDAAECEMQLPCTVAGFSDFFCGLHHAENAARASRPDGELWPNYKYMPIAYNGRAASVRPSGTALVRPNGQRRGPDGGAPEFGPCTMLDYEVELGIWIGRGSAMGAPVPIGRAWDHVFGFSLLNDWSLRDTQFWEGQPLGPFLAKNALTSVSPWLVTPEALQPFRTPMDLRRPTDPEPFAYLSDPSDRAAGGVDILLETEIQTLKMRQAGAAGDRVSAASSTALYWSCAQMIAHLTSSGSEIRTGELLGTGTISAPDRSGFGSLIELSDGGRQPIALSSGETRSFLEDGDCVTMRGHCSAPGFVSIGFGHNAGTVAHA